MFVYPGVKLCKLNVYRAANKPLNYIPKLN